MKTKIKRHSRSVIAVVLTLCMLVSCMTVGIIATDAAKTAGQRVGANADGEALGDGDTTYYMHIGAGSAFRTTSGNAFTYDSTNSYYYYDYAITANTEYVFVINTTSGTLGDGNKSSSTQTVTTLASSWNDTGATFHYNSYGSNSYDGYDAFKFKCKSDITIRFTFTSTFADGVTYRLSSGGGGGESGGGGGAGTDSGTSFPESWQRVNSTKTYATIYYDNSITQWSSVKFRIGRHWSYNGDANPKGNSSYNMTKVTGTNNIYKVTGIEWNYYNAFYFTNGSTSDAWHNDEDIETVANKGFTAYTSPKGFDLAGTSSTPTNYFFIGQSATVGTAAAPQRVLCYGAAGGSSETTASDYTTYRKSVTNNSVDHGSVVVNWTNPSGTAQTIAEGATTADMLIGTTLTVAMTADEHYAPGTATVTYAGNASSVTVPASGSTFTSGNTNTEVTGSFIKTEATHAVTISASPSEGGTVSPSTGTEVGVSTSTEITATPSAGYEFSSWTFGTGITGASTTDNPTTITTNSSGDYTVQANFTAKPTHTITVNTNNPAYGTASASVASAYQGQEVTLTATVKSGVFNKWTVTSGTMSTVDDKTDNPLTFTMGDEDLTITANFDEYTAASPFYYNSYGSNGQPALSHYGARMTEAKINGETYSYYHVTDRTEDNQLFTVSYGSPKYNSNNTYFQIPKSWEGTPKVLFYSTDEKNLGNWVDMQDDGSDSTKNKYKYPIPDGARSVRFKHGSNETSELYFTSGNNGWYTESDMSSLTGFNNSNPVEANFYENFYGTNKYTDAFSTNGFYSHYADRGENHGYTKPKGLDSATKGDYYIVVLYENKTYTINGVKKKITNNPEIIWMSELPGQSGAESTTVKVYAKDGAIRRDGDSPERNDRTYSSFEQYANTFVYSDSGYESHIGTRSSYDNQSSEGSTGYNGYTYDYVAKFNKGDTLYIKTVLKDDTFMNKYYLAAYSINGKTYALHTTAESDTRTVTEAFTVPEDWEDKYVEITPIYFLRDTAGTKMITFYIEGYDEEVMHAGWGNTPFVYPFYQDANFNYVANINNAFGGYPGQPMVFYKGNYYIQLPDKITTTISTGQTGTATIKGVTLGNGYWDDIHYHIGEVKSHFQTYDYDDLYKIYNEKGNADRIICAFKYRTKKNNDEPASMSSSIAANYNTTNGNGWEVLTNYYGQPVDVFGNVLTEGSAEYNLAMSIINGSESADTAAVVHAISQDYKSNSAGDYATEWVIYNTSGTKVVASSGGKTSIVPSALAINANTSGTGELTDNFDKYDNATKAFKSIYTALYNDSNVRGKPAVVTYEKSIYGGGDKADRCDARWYFSQKNAPITATTRIEYTDDGKTWTKDEYTTVPGTETTTGTGSHTGAKAYFTGKASTATDTPSITTGIDDTNTTTYSGNVGQGYYTIKAENAGQYQFVGWYLLRDNYQNISTRSSYAADATEFPSHAEMSKNGDIFVARFKKTATGTFDIYHEIHPQTTGYGNVSVSAVVKDGDTTLATYPSEGTTDHVTIPNTYIKSGEGYKVVATFTAAPYHTSNFDAFYATVQDLLQDFEGYDYIDSISISGGTATVTYNVDKMFSMVSDQLVQTVTNVTHYSKFSLKDNLTYSLEYTFNTRYYDTKLYQYTNVAFTEQELRSYFLDQITDPNCDHIKLDKQFVKAKAPFESNFREDLTWVVDKVTFNDPNDPTIGYLTATQVKTKWATAMVYDFDNKGEMRTTTMVAPIEKLFNASTNTKPTYPSTEAEATAISAWSVTNDQMYHPYRTSYVPAGETSSAPLYIDHWDIYQLDSFTYKTVNNIPKMMDDGYNLDVDLSKSVLVAQAYSSRFNYVGYEDYVVVPVYNKDKVDRQGASDKRTDSSATLLTLTRNQWNANVAGNNKGGSYIDSADRVYVDFMLNYNYSVKINGKDTNILLNSTEDNIQVGFIVRSYTWEDNEKHYSNAQYVLVDKDQINDKNRIEYCFGFKNNENNRRAGLYYEFKPFIVDTANQTGSEGCDVTIDNTPYKALYADSTVSVLDQVSFYQLGRL